MYDNVVSVVFWRLSIGLGFFVGAVGADVVEKPTELAFDVDAV